MIPLKQESSQLFTKVSSLYKIRVFRVTREIEVQSCQHELNTAMTGALMNTNQSWLAQLSVPLVTNFANRS